MTAVTVYTADQVAQLLGCSIKTVEQMARDGDLTGIKPGGGWVFPAGALAQRLDELALEQAAGRRKPVPTMPEPTLPAVAVSVKPGTRQARGRSTRVLPTLVPIGGPAC